VGGRGLRNITIHATGSITIADGTTISSRQVASGGNHWADASTGASGNITLTATSISVGAGANILAHADGGHAAGNVTLTAHDLYDQSWSFLGIQNFRWIATEAAIDIAMDARLTGYAIAIGDGALDVIAGNSGQANRFYLNDGHGHFAAGVAFGAALKTTALATGDFDGDGAVEVITVTDGDGIRSYEFNGTTFVLQATIDAGPFSATSIAAGDIDADGDTDFVVGVRGAANRLYLNNGSGVF